MQLHNSNQHNTTTALAVKALFIKLQNISTCIHRILHNTQVLHSWIQRSVREPAASLLRSIGVGASMDKILSTFKLAY